MLAWSTPGARNGIAPPMAVYVYATSGCARAIRATSSVLTFV